MSNEAFEAWQQTIKNRAAAAAGAPEVDWSKTKLDPSKLKCELGPMLTEEQFKEYCQKSAIKPTILRK